MFRVPSGFLSIGFQSLNSILNFHEELGSDRAVKSLGWLKPFGSPGSLESQSDRDRVKDDEEEEEEERK